MRDEFRHILRAVAVLSGALAGCDFSAALSKCEADGRCPNPKSSTRQCGGLDAGVVLLGPKPYLSRRDSPFPCPEATEFFFDDFERGTINLPGVTITLPSTADKVGELRHDPTSTAIDSVDEDDGSVDGRCAKPDGGACAALYSPNGPKGISLEWDAGALPQFVGLVWTDGRKFVRFEAFGADRASLGVIGPTAADAGFPDGLASGETAEDRFFGLVAPEGISMVRISGDDGGIEIDHVQYGRWSPRGR